MDSSQESTLKLQIRIPDSKLRIRIAVHENYSTAKQCQRRRRFSPDDVAVLFLALDRNVLHVDVWLYWNYLKLFSLFVPDYIYYLRHCSIIIMLGWSYLYH